MNTPVTCAFVALVVVAVACTPAPAEVCGGTTVLLRRDETLTAGVDRNFPPFAFDDDDGEPTGFEIELLDALAGQLGLDLLLVNRNASALVPGVLGHRHDVASSALRDTPELRSQACVSAPYLDADLGVLARDDIDLGIRSTSDLTGRRIGVVDGSRADAWADTQFGIVSLVERYVAPEDLFGAVERREVDAVVHDLPILLHSQDVYAGLSVVHAIQTDEHYVFITHPDNASLVALIDEVLADFERDGTLDDLEARWFGDRT